MKKRNKFYSRATLYFDDGNHLIYFSNKYNQFCVEMIISCLKQFNLPELFKCLDFANIKYKFYRSKYYNHCIVIEV